MSTVVRTREKMLTHCKEIAASLLHEFALLREIFEIQGIVEQIFLKSHEKLPQLNRTLAENLQLRKNHTVGGREGGRDRFYSKHC